MATESAGSIRAMNRERITAAILELAREQIASSGANSLSVRAIARELGMASSAIYRYFPSRDELLTKLIVDSYDSLGEQAEIAEVRVSREDRAGRFRAICHAVRQWALANPHEYFLIYGTPVPGYKAPEDTIAPAARVAELMIALMIEASLEHNSRKQSGNENQALHRALVPIRSLIPDEVSDKQLALGLSVFSALFGAISLELGGQLHNVITDTKTSRTAYFDNQVDIWLTSLGWD